VSKALEVLFYGYNDSEEWAFGVRSESDQSLWYDVALWPSRELAVCSCMDWSCRKRNGGLSDTCKHVRAVLVWIEENE